MGSYDTPADAAEYIRSLESRIHDLATAVGRVMPRAPITVSSASVIDLGAIDGDNITGVRISLSGQTFGTGGNTYMRVRPNGAASVLMQNYAHRVLTNGGGYTTTDSGLFGGAFSVGNMLLAATDWGTASNQLDAHGTFYTATGHWRTYLGQYANRDAVSDGNLSAAGRVVSTWAEETIPITSLSLTLDAGTFTGRVSVEIVP